MSGFCPQAIAVEVSKRCIVAKADVPRKLDRHTLELHKEVTDSDVFSPSWSTLTDTPDTCLTNPSSFIATFHKAEVTNNGSCMVVLSYQKPCPRKTFLSLELIQMGGHLLMKRRRVDAGAFGSKKCQNTSGSDDFRTFRCRKSARRCGAKHISK